MREYAWDKTVLWKRIQGHPSPAGRAVRNLIETAMEEIQTILAKGGTTPTDFSLHDEGHAFRVAELMTQIMPEDTLDSLSIYELALLLLSAYLHDIGMSPHQVRIMAYRTYLLTGDAAGLSQNDADAFDAWLLNNNHPRVPLQVDTAEAISECDSILTHFCRHCHNDWSSDWIYERFSSAQRLGQYEGWTHDLVAVCKSHHQGLQELLEPRFNPKLVDNPSVVVHLRFMACLLRVADILEFDPDRTPAVLIQHRKISPGSLLYWLKDRHVSMRIDSGKLTFFATPPNARIHRALLVMAQDIERELRLVDRINAEKPFGHNPLTIDGPHRWVLSPYFQPVIHPQDGSYEYIDGGFRPDSRRVLSLLSGTQLYEKPIVAVRELLQNAFDAVKEQVAHERLRCPDPTSPTWEDILRKAHRVVLRLETDLVGARLVCSDTGIGMAKATISDRLLVSGSPIPPEIQVLEQACENHGFSLERTGEFGIGVLSYFMLASRVVVRTLRSLQGGGKEPAWLFDMDGLEGFGELRPYSRSSHGTEVELRLLPGVLNEDPQSFYVELRNYVKEQLRHIPCTFELSSSFPNCEPLTIYPGWTHSPSTLLQPPFQWRDELDTALLARGDRTKQRLLSARNRKVKSQYLSSLNVFTLEGELPSGLGRYRAHMPYFSLPGGSCLAFMACRRENGSLITSSMVREPTWKNVYSWKGILVGGAPSLSPAFCVEIDWCHRTGGQLSVHRASFIRSDKAKEAEEWLRNHLNQYLSRFLDENSNTAYELLNRRVIREEQLTGVGQFHWLNDQIGSTEEYHWGPIRFPCVSSALLPGARKKYRWRGNPIPLYQGIAGLGSGLTPWHPRELSPNLIVEVEDVAFRLTGVWTTELGGNRRKPLSARFPPSWTNLAAAFMEGFIVWNVTHPLVEADGASYDWGDLELELEEGIFDPLSIRKLILTDRTTAAAWVAYQLDHWFDDERQLVWRGLWERSPRFILQVWQQVFGVRFRSVDECPPIMFWYGGDSEDDLEVVDPAPPVLHILTPNNWKTIAGSDLPDMRGHLPYPGDDWRLFVE